MIESIKKVSNPLTIIAIFAALAEVNGTVAIGLVNSNLQPTFIWFIICFPTLLIILFFLTLNFNPKVIYAPSDFRDEINFVKTISGSLNLDKIQYTVTSDANDVKKVKEQVEKNLESVAHSDQTPREEKLLTKKANSFFEVLLNDINPLFEQGVLQELSFGIETPEFFILSYSIKQDKLISPRRLKGEAVIIRLAFEDKNDISLEAIGKNIKEIDHVSFARKLSDYLKHQVDNSTNPDRKNKFDDV
jgi:hypothetical protein